MTNTSITSELNHVVRVAYEGCGEAICLPALYAASHEVSTTWEGEGWYQVGWRNETTWYETANDLAFVTYSEALETVPLDGLAVIYRGDGEDPEF